MNPANWKLGTYWYHKDPVSLAELKDAGIACIELNLDYMDPDQVKTLHSFYDGQVQQAKQLGIELWSVHIPFGGKWNIAQLDDAAYEAAIEANSFVIEWASQWGARVVVIHPSAEPIRTEEREAMFECSVAAIRRLSEHAAALGLKLAVEDLPRTCLGNTTAETAALIAEAPHAVVCCDTNHLLTEKPEDFIRTIGGRIATLHVSDYDGIDEKHWLPGQGIVNWPEVIQALIETGYDGPFMMEANFNTADELVNSFRTIIRAHADKYTG